MTSDPGTQRFTGVWATLTVAMNQHQLHNPAEARRALTQAREKFAVEGRDPAEAASANRFRWHLSMLDEALLHEAEALIDGTPTASRRANPNTPLVARASWTTLALYRFFNLKIAVG